MRIIDESIREAIVFANKETDEYRKSFSNTFVGAYTSRPDTRDIVVVLHGNRVFGYSRNGKSEKWWVNNCGWPSRTTQNRINDALIAIGAPYRVYVSKERQMIRNTDTNEYAILGDGRVENANFKDLTWHGKNAKR